MQKLLSSIGSTFIYIATRLWLWGRPRELGATPQPQPRGYKGAPYTTLLVKIRRLMMQNLLEYIMKFRTGFSKPKLMQTAILGNSHSAELHQKVWCIVMSET